MNWIDNADSYICPACGQEVSSPANVNFTCPKCGFVAKKDKPVVSKAMSEQRLIDANAMVADESEAYMKAQTSGAISPITQEINSVVHGKIQMLIFDTPTIDPETLPIRRGLREKLKKVTIERDEARRDCAVAESNHSECLAQLAEARVQLKSAITDMEALMWHSGDGCNICRHCVEVHREPYVRLGCDLGSGCECKPEWRGTDGDHP